MILGLYSAVLKTSLAHLGRGGSSFKLMKPGWLLSELSLWGTARRP
jgi:hypothetical protein